MPKPNYQFEKRQREQEKKKKKEEKAQRKADTSNTQPGVSQPGPSPAVAGEVSQ